MWAAVTWHAGCCLWLCALLVGGTLGGRIKTCLVSAVGSGVAASMFVNVATRAADAAPHSVIESAAKVTVELFPRVG